MKIGSITNYNAAKTNHCKPKSVSFKCAPKVSEKAVHLLELMNGEIYSAYYRLNSPMGHNGLFLKTDRVVMPVLTKKFLDGAELTITKRDVRDEVVNIVVKNKVDKSYINMEVAVKDGKYAKGEVVKFVDYPTEFDVSGYMNTEEYTEAADKAIINYILPIFNN